MKLRYKQYYENFDVVGEVFYLATGTTRCELRTAFNCCL